MKILFKYILVIFFLWSCATTKYVPDGEQLLIKNSIVVDSIPNNSEELNEYLVQRPNFRTLGVPFSLYFYNIGNPKESEEVYLWKRNHHKIYRSISSLFSEKQAISFASSLIGFNQWFLKNGESPVVINTKKLFKTQKNIKAYFMNNGYFDAEVSFKKDTVALKKAEVSYFVTKGKPLLIDNVHTQITSPVLDSLYKRFSKKVIIRRGMQYNNKLFKREVSHLTYLFRNNGVYHFNQNAIEFKVDTISKKYKANIYTVIKDRVLEENGGYISKDFRIQKIKKVNVYTDTHFSKKDNYFKEKEFYKGINFYSFDKLRYKPKHLASSIFIRPGDPYKDNLLNLTRSHLRSLKNFKTTKISFKELNDSELEANIYLSPQDNYTWGIDTQLSRSNIRIYDVSTKFSFLNKNLFKGAELLNVSGFGSYFKTNKDFGWELGSDLSLEVPRFMAPFGLSKLVPKRMFPKTRFSIGASTQKNIGLDRNIFSIGVDYKWKKKSEKFIQLELLNTQYIRNSNVHQYFNIYRSEFSKLSKIASITNTQLTMDYNPIVNFMNTKSSDQELKRNYTPQYNSLLNVLNRYNIITSDFLIPVLSFSFTYNNQRNFRDTNFSFFKIRLANSGNFLGYLIDEENFRDKKVVFNIPIAQYFKTDIEYKKFWNISRTSVLGVRFFGGLILPYNDSDIPFSKSYFAGGSNDIRAWRAYDLGPGSRLRGLEYNVGNLKFLSNLEYRFNFIGNFKGAIFVDSGNIWNFSTKKELDKSSKLNNLYSFKNIAIGTGFGIRYDLKFLVARLDLGYKVREPYLLKNKWFSNFNFSNTEYNIGINYPF